MNKTIVYLSLGTNLGNKKENLKNAVLFLGKNHIKILKTSSVYKTEPIGYKNQPEFLNMVLKGKVDLSPENLLKIILKIEKKLGRKRKQQWGPRIIDIDILLFNNKIITNNNLTIPHPQMHKRNFVLVPLLEIESDLIHPVFKKKLKSYIKNNSGEVVKICR